MSDATGVIRAQRNGKYYLRFLLMGFGALGFGLYCVYDGMIAYPDHQARQLAFHEYKQMKEEGDPQAAEKWEALAKEKGWSPRNPGEPLEEKEFAAKVAGQFVMAAVCGVAALGFFAFSLSSLGRWIEANNTAIVSSWGEEVPFNQVTGIDKRKWQNKGIAKVKYKNGGKTRVFVIDDFKFLRQPTDAILYRLEQNVDPALITGGKPEKPPAVESAVKGEPVSSESAV